MSIHTERGALKRARSEGPALFFVSVAPKEEARAIVGIVPGYADYGDRYDEVQRGWAHRGLASVAIDLRGHGYAEGPRGACKQWEEFLDDVKELFALLEARASGKPIFLFGHSFGGLVASSWTLRNPSTHRGLVLSSPFMRVALPVPGAKRAAGKLVSKLLPGIGLASGLKGAQMMHDPAKQKAYDEDPLIFQKANVRWFTETERAQGEVMAGAKGIALPLYIAYGTADGVVAGARELFDAAGSDDKTLDMREGLFHEILNEPEGPAIANAMADWILARV